MITKRELAEKLSVSVMTIDRMMKKGLPYLKVGKSVRFDYDKVIKWLEERQ